MSAHDNDISKFSAAGADDDDDGDSDARRHGVVHVRSGTDTGDCRRKNYGYGFRRNVSKAKKVVLFPFTKANKYFNLRRSRNPNLKQPSFSNLAASSAATVPDHQSGSGSSSRIGVVNSCFCFTQPQTSQTPDCNDSNFTFDMLKALIEKNDFYSRECNHHLDFAGPSPSCHREQGRGTLQSPFSL